VSEFRIRAERQVLAVKRPTVEGRKATQEKAVTVVEHYRVSPRLNNPKNQSAELIEPFENPA